MFGKLFNTTEVDRFADWIVSEVRNALPPAHKKARLAARVREGMNAHGYPEPFIKSFSYDLLTRIQTVSSKAVR
jgi:hypothetical protein